MFDLVTGAVDRPFHERSVGSNIVSVAGHSMVLLALVGISLFSATAELPRVRAMKAFVVAKTASVPAPPLPPPPAAPRTADNRPSASAPTPPLVASGNLVAPVEAPSELPTEEATNAETDFGVAGGIAGSVAGGVAGGVVSSVLPAEPPRQRTPVAPPAPVRAGGLIAAPKLLVQVQPTYPPLAAAAKVTGVVILEATVGADGCVESVRVLASQPLLDKAAVEAVKRWQYSPLILNGIPTPFVLTVTVSFSAKK